MMHKIVAQRLNVKFKWGENDCVSFALECNKAKGNSLSLPFAWKNKRDAYEEIKKIESIETYCLENVKQILPTLARDGDFWVDKNTVWVFYGAHIIAPGENGLVFKDRGLAKCAFTLSV